MQSHDHLYELEDYIIQMQRIAFALRILGLGMLVITLLNLGMVAGAAVRIFSSFISLQLSAAFFISAVLLAMFFEQFRRRGEVIYGEVTDELHQGHANPMLDRPRISFRIALKNFASSMDMPLIPGRYGGSLYLLLNLCVLLFAFSTYRLYQFS